MFNDYLLVFGGDRHQMPFNDLFVLDFSAELVKQKDGLYI